MDVLSDVVNHFKYDWQHQKSLFFLEMWSTLSALIGALALAYLNTAAPFVLIYIIFFTSSSCSVISGHMRKSGWLVVVGVCFSLINIIGIVKAL
jgi:hypothetical protein